ncbi:MAG TPA: HAMP domain-containing sensor histidine kinase [Tepidisphaeraceae bacterium]|nr:HAMP domain-containing sensor histidine kinase [Tepidisphaeraceae bacterium]
MQGRINRLLWQTARQNGTSRSARSANWQKRCGARKSAIVREHEQTVDSLIPAADRLTRKQVRNSLPIVLDQIAGALESTDPAETWKITHTAVEHGVTRFHQQYDVKQLISEFRLFRRIVLEEVTEELQRELSLPEMLALATGIDLYLQQSVVAFVEFQREQLRAASEMEAKYLSYLSHDLRNNLNAVTLMLEVLHRRLKDLPEFREDAEDVAALQRSIDETVQGMDRLLQAERIRTKAVEAKFERVELKRIALHVVRQHHANAATKNIELIEAVPDHAVAQTDPDLLGVTLQNLVGNAVKYSSKGRVELGAAEKTSWELFVADQGPGIPPEHQGRIFNAFSRGETHGQSGVGLGLTIAARAAEVIGAQLSFDSTPGAGTTFRLLLPPRPPGA